MCVILDPMLPSGNIPLLTCYISTMHPFEQNSTLKKEGGPQETNHNAFASTRLSVIHVEAIPS